MLQNVDTIGDLEEKLTEIDEAIIAHNSIVHKLTIQRYDLISRKQNLEITEALECAIENDISPRKMMDLMISEIEKRHILHCDYIS